MKILIMGAGAVGAYFGARLLQTGEEVVFCARGHNLRAMRERGLEIRSPRGDFKGPVCATDEPREFAPYDLALFCVKAYDTAVAIEAMSGTFAPDGVVINLQNGVEGEKRLSDAFGATAVMGGNARVGVELIAPGIVHHYTTGTIEFGELTGGESVRARRIAEMFSRAGILGELSPDIITSRWSKLLWNAAFNAITTLTRRTVGEVLSDPEGERLVRTVMNETLAVAQAAGAKLGADRIESLLEHSRNNLPALRTSTQQDFQRGRRLEYDALSGAVLRAARRHRIPVPATETIHTMLKLLDRSVADS